MSNLVHRCFHESYVHVYFTVIRGLQSGVQEMGLQDGKVNAYVTLLGIAKFISRKLAQICTPVSNVCVYLLPHDLGKRMCYHIGIEILAL